MPDDPRDPLDEPDGLLSEDDALPTEPAEPEPAPSLWEEPPTPDAAEWQPEPEPDPSPIEAPAEPPPPPLIEEDEPVGDDLSWVEDLQPEPAPWDDDEPTEEAPQPDGDWDLEEASLPEDDWRDLEDERKMLPVGRVLVGYRERASLPELGLHELVAWMQTGRPTSSLTGPAAEDGGVMIDGVRIEASHIDALIDIGGLQLAATLAVLPGEPALWLGRDALTSVVVDPTPEGPAVGWLT